jgi:hypothetical protein
MLGLGNAIIGESRQEGGNNLLPKPFVTGQSRRRWFSRFGAFLDAIANAIQRYDHAEVDVTR